MANHSLILDKRKMIITLRIFKKYKDILLMNEDDIINDSYPFIDDKRFNFLENQIQKSISKDFLNEWEIEKINLYDENYKVNVLKYNINDLEKMEESKFIWFNWRKYLIFFYSFPNDEYSKNHNKKIRNSYSFEQRINDLIIFYDNNLKYDWENKEYSEYADDFIYKFKELFEFHEIRAWYKMDNDYVFYWWMKDALENYDEKIHYDISWNEYKKMCAEIYQTKYGSENEENDFFLFRNC